MLVKLGGLGWKRVDRKDDARLLNLIQNYQDNHGTKEEADDVRPSNQLES